MESLIGLTLFVLLFSVSMWKFKAFFSTQILEDDDRTAEAEAKLSELVQSGFITAYQQKGEGLTLSQLFDIVTHQSRFDTTHFWRFNHNRLRKMVQLLHEKHQTTSDKALYESLVNTSH